MKSKSQMLAACAMSSVVLWMAGCSSKMKPTNENFMAGLNTYYANHDDCLFQSALRFPYEVSPGPDAKADKERMDALLKAALVKREEEQSIHVDIYTLTAAGMRAGGRFCYGHRQVTSIDSFTPPAKSGSFLETQVMYRYTMIDVPVWAKTPEVQKAFPALETALSGAATGQAALANAGVGWQVPN